METIIIIIAFWLICGFINWAAALGDLAGKFPDDNMREHYGIAGFMAFAGPFGTLVLIFCTNFYQHGFRLK